MDATDKTEVLKSYFGYGELRQGQGELIDAILSGRDVLGVMPTGGGKSLCYQIPALMLPGVTLVVSPLISLMADQVAALRRSGVSAAFLNSSLSADEARSVYAAACAGEYKLLYVAPERLGTAGFASAARKMDISLAAVDEAHCVSQWGQDFRPSYLHIAEFISSLKRRPTVAAFTATATQQVRADIIKLLELRQPLTVVTGFNRPNLYFDVLHSADKGATLLRLIKERAGKSGIVYCSTRSAVERVEAMLRERGISATRYHAGLDEAERERNQQDFQFDRRSVMVATNAFGMGIDKSNVDFVIHYNMPKSIEAYYQEAGRAGRDGEPADCILLYSASDVATARRLLQNSGNSELDSETQAQVRRRDLERLDAMTGYCSTHSCLRGYILGYFGQSHPESCGNCGNCRGQFATENVTRSAQMVISCVIRIRRLLGYYMGRKALIDCLLGSSDAKVLSLGLDKLSTYGLLKGTRRSELSELIDWLLMEGYLYLNAGHSTVEPGPRSREALRADAELLMPRRVLPKAERSPAGRSRAAPEMPEGVDEGLYEALRAVRSSLASAEKVPPYVICSNATLRDMALLRPRDMRELLLVSGIGEKKAERYGSAFLHAVAGYMAAKSGSSRA